MAPRAYALGKRAGTAAETRTRILRAAMASFSTRGLRGTTLAGVAREADVSRGSILHHFGSADGLLEAVLDQIQLDMQARDARILEGAQTREERVRRFVDAIARFYDRSSDWWRAFEPNTRTARSSRPAKRRSGPISTPWAARRSGRRSTTGSSD